MNAAAALGAFDPLALGLTFSCAKHDGGGSDTATDQEIPASMSSATSADLFRSVIMTLQRVVPAELLTHEMTHLYQITATCCGAAR